MGKITVLITGVGGGGVGRQVLKALRLCGDRYQIIGTDISPYSLGLYDADEWCILPPASDSKYIQSLVNICHQTNTKVVVPGSEPELRKIAENRGKFDGILLLINSPDIILRCLNKWETYLFLVNNGIDAPYSYQPDIGGCDENILPAIIKPALGGGGSFNCYIAQDMNELRFFMDYIKRQGLHPMAQKYVGSCLEEYTVGVLTDMEDGELLGSIAVRRQILSGLSNRMRIRNRNGGDMLVVSSGISQGEVGDFSEVRKHCEKAALKFSSRGPMNFQCRKDGDKVYIFEINPRFSGTTFIRAMMGFNGPDMLIRRHLLGEDIKPGEYKKGVVLRGLEERQVCGTD